MGQHEEIKTISALCLQQAGYAIVLAYCSHMSNQIVVDVAANPHK